jgi:hypothetical protein
MADALASPGPRYVRRFTLSERLLHWVHATAFFVLLASGLVLYLPALSGMVGRHSLRALLVGRSAKTGPSSIAPSGVPAAHKHRPEFSM